MYQELKECILCGIVPQQSLEPVFDMGNQYVVDFVKDKDEKLLKCPLVLMKCKLCNLIQLKHRVNPDRLYRKFWYRSGINPQMRNELLAIVQKAQRVVNLNHGDKVLDIGCNDGTMLGWYPKGIVTVGIDPASELVAEGMKSRGKDQPRRIDFGISDYFSADRVRYAFKSMGAPPPQFKVITAIAMFYDVINPIEFLRDCRDLLHGEGVLIIQMNYLKTMIENTGFDNISHEHLAYYSVMTLNTAVRRAGLDLAGIELSKSNGGSVRAYITHNGFDKFCENDTQDKLYLTSNANLRMIEEMRAGLNIKSTYETFGHNVESKMAVLKNYLKDISSKEPVYAYGASTRGTALVQYLFKDGGSNMIKGVAEKDETKYGLKMVGTWWDILPEKDVRSKCKAMFVLPWHFKESFVEREKSWLMGGGSFIFPLPKPGITTGDELVTKEQPLGV